MFLADVDRHLVGFVRLNVESLRVVRYGICLFLGLPATLSLPSFFQVGVSRKLVFEVSLRHSSHVSVLQRRVESVNRLHVALRAVVNISEAALVRALLPYVHLCCIKCKLNYLLL